MPANINPRRSSSVAHSAAQSMPAIIERARVLNVNIRDFTVDVSSEFTFKPKFDIPIMTPYCNQANGEGLNVMPEIGSMCWVCEPSEEGRDAFVLGFTMVDEGGSYRGGRDLLNPGDVHFKTRDDNFLFLRRGGIVQIGSTPVCQRVYLPVRNIIQDYAENYELHTPAGDLTWEVARKEDDGEGHQACLYTLAYKEFADDPNEETVGLLKFGSHGEGNDIILSLLTRDRGGGTKQTCLEINKAGEISWTMKKLDVRIEGDLSALATGSASLRVDGPLDIVSGAALTAAANSISLTAGAVSLVLDGTAKMDGAQVLLGTAEYPALRMSPDMLAWIGTVTATLSGASPGNPVVTLGPGVLLPPVLHISPKVKV